jgi:hypothetical protein
MQFIAIGQSFDGCDLIAFVHYRERQTGIDASSVYQYGAGAALAVIASLFRTGELQPLPQSIEQRHTRIHVERVILAVNA